MMEILKTLAERQPEGFLATCVVCVIVIVVGTTITIIGVVSMLASGPVSKDFSDEDEAQSYGPSDYSAKG